MNNITHIPVDDAETDKQFYHKANSIDPLPDTNAVSDDKVEVHGYPSKKEEIDRTETIEDVQDEHGLLGIEERAQTRLFSLQTVFPFDPIPNSIAIDENKVDIIVRTFFQSEQVYSLLLSDIKSVTVTTSLLFARMFFEVTGYETNPPRIPYIWKSDAYTARDLLQGLLTCQKESIDVSKFNDKNIKKRLIEIGKSHPH